MALNADDPRPTDLSVQERYEKLRAWYQGNVARFAAQDDSVGHYAKLSEPYIRSLPPPGSASPADIEATFKEALMGRLEWAYHKSDGQYKMAAYAGT